MTVEKLQLFANKFAEKITLLFVKKETGKGLSTNDYTNTEKEKLAGIEEGAEKNPILAVAADVLTPDSSGYIFLSDKLATKYELSTNYYDKTAVDGMVTAIPKFKIEVVQTLPATNISSTTVYLVKSGEESQNLYTEYIYVDSKWEKLGTQGVDLSGYLTKELGVSNVTKKDNTHLTITRGDGTSFDVEVVGTTYGNATSTDAGLMSATDKAKLDGMEDITEEDINNIIAGTFSS